MATIFNGKDSALLLQNISDPTALLPAICNRNLEYERQRELIEKTTLAGYEVGHILGLKRGSVTFNNLSVFLEPGDEGYYDELCRQWFESGDLLLCKLRDVEGANIREIIFFGFMESYRIVRNNMEVANFDITIRQSDYDASIPCPVVTITNYLEDNWTKIDYEFTTNILVFSYVVTLYDATDTVIASVTYTTFGATISGTFSSEDYSISVDTIYRIGIAITWIETNECPGSLFMSYNVPCPILSLEVGETTVDVSLTVPDNINRAVVQIASSIDPVTIFGFVLEDAPFDIPQLYAFTGLSTTTTYWARVIIQNIGGNAYSKTCGWVEFTTGEPYVPPTVTSYIARFNVVEDDVCGEDPITVYSSTNPWAPGMSLFYDESLSSPVLVFDFVAYNGNIYEYNIIEGQVGDLTGNICE